LGIELFQLGERLMKLEQLLPTVLDKCIRFWQPYHRRFTLGETFSLGYSFAPDDVET
jgi:hypothetical protein